MSDSVIQVCPQCGAQLAADLRVCLRCGRLLHADRLNALAQAAREAAAQGDLPAALASWREALELLPPDTRQYEVVSAKITELGGQLAAGGKAARPVGAKNPGVRLATGAGAVGLMLWKLKALFLGLTKGTTLLTMLLSLGVYWTAWGWKFALGLVLSIYVHEMGHMIALRRYGFKSTAPMFIPGFGALIRLQQQVVNPLEDAEIGLAGPVYGLGAAVVALAIWYATGQPIFAAIAGVGAWINLFNLLPFGTLDGGRGFHALSRLQKFFAVAAVAGSFYFTSDGLLLLLGLVCIGRAVGDKSEQKGSWKVAITYVVLILALAALSTVRSLAGAGG